MFALSQEFFGHEQDVKAVVAHQNTIFSASRDSSVREWRPATDSITQNHEYKIHQGFVNSITYHEDYVVSGGQDTIINLVKPGALNAEYSLIGHTANVCALHASQGLIASGSWDGTAKLWSSGQCVATMEGHQGAVWAVLITEHGLLTGGADKTIRLWKEGRQIKNYPSGKDCVRALALHPLGFISTGNDSIIRIHSFDGEILQQLEGHESFIYSLAVSSDGTIYSAGEDRTLRIWKNGVCTQTIPHPAVSVWAVALLDNGDVVTGASDAVVRVFTSTEARKASVAELEKYEASIVAAAPAAQGTNIPNNLPGLEALAGPGKKEGEVKMIRTSPDLVEAHQWSGGVWTKIGEVVGATAKKVEYEGKEWDFVFDVDIAEGAPPLKLPYNTEENPYEAANRFIAKYELDVGFQAQIVKFIETNTGGVPLGVAKSPAQPESKQAGASLTPQATVLPMNAGNAAPIKKKLLEFAAIQEYANVFALESLDPREPSPAQLDALIETVSIWPREKRFPSLDLLRLSILNASENTDMEKTLSVVLSASEFQTVTVKDKTRETNMMLGLRFIANCYAIPRAKQVMIGKVEAILDAVSAVDVYSNKNLSLALATCLLNASVTIYTASSAIDAINLIEPMIRLLRNTQDAEVQFRTVIALGTILHISDDVVEAARDVFEATMVLKGLHTPLDERVKNATSEVLGLLRA